MSTAAQDSSRPLTRSMTSNAVRRSARLRDNPEKRRSWRRSSPPLLQGSSESDVRHRPKKRTRLSAQDEDAPHSSKSHKCGQVTVELERRTWHRGSRGSGASGRGSIQSARTAVCSRESSRVRELEEQLDTVLHAKQELVSELKAHKITGSQMTLKHLEEYFTCPLCFEIMACPYTLTPRNCGHTFCATCILKWLFSRLHKGCGGWHEAVDCPLCRSSLPHTPERTPRSLSSFPFTPNRIADVAIRGLINMISHELAGAATSSSLSDWAEDGHSKQEWSKRERMGRMEMTTIAATWTTLRPTDFINIKNRLEV